MKITIEPTDQITTFEGRPVRVWRGVTGRGNRCEVLVAALATPGEADQTEFEAELAEVPAPVEMTLPLALAIGRACGFEPEGPPEPTSDNIH